ncbi:MAG: DUF6029 family protein [Bacteroidales bacterium]|mgnify:CR=1 FL=1|jgi:hypothetical protein|nr:hypothetical protein [Bacteroidales bacterium]MDI9575301.1 DUF6029 family protein [Bacteroidota bacterium]MDD2592879.1 DUF6029 family protein [Bacteroidales bacterium]MDD3755387.1 DUF6029 family protein [Bacteroidales bacterium]MDY0400661.1 DUF6029 family protein [Bacteroidales bacterium]
MQKNLFFILFLLITLINIVHAQEGKQSSQIYGDFQLDAMYYLTDSTISAYQPKEKLGNNAYLSLFYEYGNISAGLRFESFLPPLIGYDPQSKGIGIAHRYIAYETKNRDLKIKAGHIYEQFGLGLSLRTYEDRSLGIDNAIDGIEVIYSYQPYFTIKGLIGTQKFFWDKTGNYIRAIDGEIYLNKLNQKWAEGRWNFTLGSSFVSKYEEDKDPIYKLPENIGIWTIRYQLSSHFLLWNTELALKSQDPSKTNNYIYREGIGAHTDISFFGNNWGIYLAAHRMDNMDFRMLRNESATRSIINYIPALTPPQNYILIKSYPYASQSNGEWAFSGQGNFTFPKNTALGGKYGTQLQINYSRIHNIDHKQINDTTPFMSPGTDGYSSEFFKIDKEVFFESIDFYIDKKITKDLKFNILYNYTVYNSYIIEGHDHGTFYIHNGVIDLNYKLPKKNSLKIQLAHEYKEQYNKNWLGALIELAISNKWFISVQDEFNYGNPDKDHRKHYYLANITYLKSATRISLSYGKMREGIMCVGGVCRWTPAYYGFGINISTTF